MAKSTNKHVRTGRSREESRRTPTVGLWTTRTTSSGTFTEAKRSGDVFKGSRREA